MKKEEIKRMAKRYRSFETKDIIGAVKEKREDFRPEAIELIEKELSARNVPIDEWAKEEDESQQISTDDGNLNSNKIDSKIIGKSILLKQTIYSSIRFTLSYFLVMVIINTVISIFKMGYKTEILASILLTATVIFLIKGSFKYEKKSRIYGGLIFLVIFTLDHIFLGGIKTWLNL